jgi:hypothetical protein
VRSPGRVGCRSTGGRPCRRTGTGTRHNDDVTQPPVGPPDQDGTPSSRDRLSEDELAAAAGTLLHEASGRGERLQALLRDTPLDELVGYLLAVILIIGVGAVFVGPILNFIFGPATVITCVAVAKKIGRWRRGATPR